jgi:hypothetical protein
MAELKSTLGTTVDMTVFRKLATLDYMTSYTHGGQYYALRESADFDGKGIWSCREARFSQHGTLLDTAAIFVEQANAGLFAGELSEALGVEVKDALLKLVREERVARERLLGRYLYCSADPARHRQQVAIRHALRPDEPFGDVPRPTSSPSDEAKAAVILFLSSLNEKQRRLFAGLESMRMGRGGDQRIAEWTGLAIHTVAKGRHELMSGDIKIERIRKPGAGRRAVEKKRQGSSPPSNS